MPYLKLRTNSSINKEQSPELLAQLSRLVAAETGKPERYVMVDLEAGQDMCFAGERTPLAFVECKSIGLNETQAKSLSSAISLVLQDALGISGDRTYIEFSDSPAQFWGWNGATFG